MYNFKRTYSVLAALVITYLFIFVPGNLLAHCDGLDGPVVKDAKKALKTENVNLVLIWVQEKDENEIRRAFEHTLKVRKLGESARKLADTFFFIYLKLWKSRRIFFFSVKVFFHLIIAYPDSFRE